MASPNAASRFLFFLAALLAAGCGAPPPAEVGPVRLHVAPGLPGAYVVELAARMGIAKPVLVARPEEAELAWFRDPAGALALGARAAPGSAPDQPGLPDAFADKERRFVPLGAAATVLVLSESRATFEPRSYADLADARLRGKVALARLGAGNGPTLAALLEQGYGERAVRGWVARLAASKPIVVESDAAAIALVAEGRAAVALVDTLAVGASGARGSLRVVFPGQEGSGCAAVPTALVLLPGAGASARRLGAWLAGPAAEQLLAGQALGLLPLRAGAVPADGFEPVERLDVITLPWDRLAERRRIWEQRLADWPGSVRGGG